MIKTIWIISAALWAHCALAEAARAEECPVGTQQTLTGSMSAATDGGDGNWVSMNVENVQPCSIAMLQGKGKVPRGCGFGTDFAKRKFMATGIVRDTIGLVLIVVSIRCS